MWEKESSKNAILKITVKTAMVNHAVTKSNENILITWKCDYSMLLSEIRVSQNIIAFVF